MHVVTVPLIMAAIRYKQVFKTLADKYVGFKSVQLLGKRTFLSAQYTCDHAWQKRLEDPLIKKINIGSFFIELNNQFDETQRISAIDLDLFVHTITKENHLEDLEGLLYKFRHSLDAIHLLPSTSHAVIRTYLQFGQYSTLLKILSDRINYGIFPDDYCNNLMMDTFLKQTNNRDATRIASLMMLQEDFTNPIGRYLALYSCLSHLKDPQPDLWEPEPPPPEPKETDDIVIIRLNYLKPNYFDDHFDVKEPTKLVGKTLVMLGSELDNELGRTCVILGYALFEKWDKLISYLQNYLNEQQTAVAYSDCISLLNNIVEKIPVDESGNSNPKILELKPLIKQLESKTKNEDMLQCVKNLIKDAVTSNEASEIDEQLKMYDEWKETRTRLVDEQVKDHIRKMRIKKLEEVKADLKKKEQLLYFFENYETNMRKVDDYDKVAAEVAEIEKKSKTEEDYIPPDIRGSKVT